MTAVVLYLLALCACFALVNVLLHREVRAERRRERESAAALSDRDAEPLSQAPADAAGTAVDPGATPPDREDS